MRTGTEVCIFPNGLCILHEDPDMLQSYQREVISGPGSFAVTCRVYADFAATVRHKLVQELRPSLITAFHAVDSTRNEQRNCDAPLERPF